MHSEFRVAICCSATRGLVLRSADRLQSSDTSLRSELKNVESTKPKAATVEIKKSKVSRTPIYTVGP